MKVLRFFPLLLLTLLACTDDATNGTSSQKLESTESFAGSGQANPTGYVPIYIHDIPAAEDLNASPISTGGFGQVIKPDLTRFQAQVLTRDFWVFEFYVDDNATLDERRNGAGQWLKFNVNGTFTGGHWDRQTHAGAWYMDYQENTPLITIDSNVDRLDGVWDIQAINGDQDAMGWVRRFDRPFGFKQKTMLQAKLIRLSDRPTKEQFAHIFKPVMGQ